jgi:hypothetical protein
MLRIFKPVAFRSRLSQMWSFIFISTKWIEIATQSWCFMSLAAVRQPDERRGSMGGRHRSWGRISVTSWERTQELPGESQNSQQSMLLNASDEHAAQSPMQSYMLLVPAHEEWDCRDQAEIERGGRARAMTTFTSAPTKPAGLVLNPLSWHWDGEWCRMDQLLSTGYVCVCTSLYCWHLNRTKYSISWFGIWSRFGVW